MCSGCAGLALGSPPQLDIAEADDVPLPEAPEPMDVCWDLWLPWARDHSIAEDYWGGAHLTLYLTVFLQKTGCLYIKQKTAALFWRRTSLPKNYEFVKFYQLDDFHLTNGLVILTGHLCLQDKRTYVEGTKLTGDDNVPAGHVAFKAAIGSAESIPGYTMYPPELGIRVGYKGKGRVAKAKYTEPR